MSSWALDVDKPTPNEADAWAAEASRWQRHVIYRVPAFIKELNPTPYRPQVVSLGPFHHGDAALLPMEAHKRRALAHLLRRSGRPLQEFRAAMRGAGVAEQLESAYRDLGAAWCGDDGRERFLDMLIVDGCFLLEAMRVAKDVVVGVGVGGGLGEGYASSDPVFSRHGVLYVMPFVQRDMLMLENQLPLLVLERLVAVMTAQPPSHEEINRMVLRFLSPSSSPPAGGGVELGLHPLAVYRGSLLGRGSSRRPKPDSRDSLDAYQEATVAIIRPAAELHEAGVRFKKSRSESLRDVWFSSRRGGGAVLSVPALAVDDATECVLLNMMAFERLHAGAGNDVAAYVFLMSSVLRSAGDVALLRSEGVVQSAAAGGDKAVAQMFERMARDVVVVLEPESAVVAVHRQVNAYCRRRRPPWRMCGGARLSRCLRTTTWAILAVVLVVVLIVQTIYTALQFYMIRRR